MLPIPMAPRCYRAIDLTGQEGLFDHISPNRLGEFDEERERAQTERYLSQAYPDNSRNRLSWKSVDVGRIVIDPRTWHPASYT